MPDPTTSSRARRSGARAPAVAGAVLAVALVLVLQGVALERQSLTMDEPYHLMAGYQTVATGTYLLNWAHPPLVKLVAGLPLAAEPEPPFPDATADRALQASTALFDDPARAARVRRHGRLAVALAFGLPFLLAAFAFGAACGGRRVGVVLALALGLAFSVLPYLPLVLTDAAVGLGYLLFLLGGLSLARRPALPAALVAGLGCGLALAAKFSGVFLLPALALAVVLAPAASPRRRLGLFAAAIAVALLVPWSTYRIANRDLDPTAGRATLELYVGDRATLIVRDRLAPATPLLEDALALDPGLGQWATGFLGVAAQNRIGVYPSYAFGRVDSDGRWWYFPVLFVVKTPLVLLAATVAALLALRRRRRETSPATEDTGLRRRRNLLLAAVALLYLIPALASSYNLGFRHLLPVLPILWLPAAVWAARRPIRGVLLIGLLALEALVLAPTWMSATNTWWLGSANPTRLAFGGDNLEYKQNFLALDALARRRDLHPLHVVFPGSSPAEIRATLPGAVAVAPGQPLEPGWYAVTLMAEQLVPAILHGDPDEIFAHDRYLRIARAWQPVLDELERRGENHGVVAGSFRLYRLPDRLTSSSGRASSRRRPR